MRLDAQEGVLFTKGNPTIGIVALPGLCAFPLVFVVSPLLYFSFPRNTLRVNTLSLPVIHLM